MSTTLTTPTAASPVPATDREPFGVLLESQRAVCVREHERAIAETVASNPDPVAVSRAATLLDTIVEIDAALSRIAAGTYGACVQCGDAIPEERLEFRPFAASCVSCPSPSR